MAVFEPCINVKCKIGRSGPSAVLYGVFVVFAIVVVVVFYR